MRLLNFMMIRYLFFRLRALLPELKLPPQVADEVVLDVRRVVKPLAPHFPTQRSQAGRGGPPLPCAAASRRPEEDWSRELRRCRPTHPEEPKVIWWLRRGTLV